jgi:hypothetical protein
MSLQVRKCASLCMSHCQQRFIFFVLAKLAKYPLPASKPTTQVVTSAPRTVQKSTKQETKAVKTTDKRAEFHAVLKAALLKEYTSREDALKVYNAFLECER